MRACNAFGAAFTVASAVFPAWCLWALVVPNTVWFEIDRVEIAATPEGAPSPKILVSGAVKRTFDAWWAVSLRKLDNHGEEIATVCEVTGARREDAGRKLNFTVEALFGFAACARPYDKEKNPLGMRAGTYHIELDVAWFDALFAPRTVIVVSPDFQITSAP